MSADRHVINGNGAETEAIALSETEPTDALIPTATAIKARILVELIKNLRQGHAPAILTALPCLVMCGARLCMNKLIGGGRSCESQPADRSTDDLTERRRETDA